jgi:hypothetical protein
MEEISIIGLDLAKDVFQVHGATRDGRRVFSKKVRRVSTGTEVSVKMGVQKSPVWRRLWLVISRRFDRVFPLVDVRAV